MDTGSLATTGTLQSPVLSAASATASSRASLAAGHNFGSTASLSRELDGSQGSLSRVPSGQELSKPLRKNSSTGFRRSRVDLTVAEKERSRNSSRTDLASLDVGASVLVEARAAISSSPFADGERIAEM